jgi:transposase
VFYPSKQKVKGLLEMPAGLNIKTGKVHYWFYDWKNSFVVIECLEKLLEEYPEEKIYVIMDNWSAHKSYNIRVWNSFHPRIHLVYLPSGASFLNKIERVFGFVHRDVLQNSNFKNVDEAMKRISNYFEKEGSIMV